MSYQVRQMPLPTSLYTLKAPFAMTPRSVTIHNTANDASAENEIRYMQSNSDTTSFHIAVDDREVIESISTNRNAWHAGDGADGPGNRTSVGIEICYSKSGGERYKKAEANAIDYTARLLRRLGLKPSDVRYHKEWSGKNCPHRILDEGRGQAVKDAIEKRYKELGNAPTVSPPPLQPPKGEKVGTATMLKDVQAYARPEFGTQTKTVFKKGTVRHIYAIQRGWYQTFSGEWIPSNYRKNFDFKPVNAPNPPTPTPTAARRVTVDGKQVGTFEEKQNILNAVEKALRDNAKSIDIQKK